MTTIQEAHILPGETISVLDKGFVRLDSYEASDLAAVNAARVSFAKHKTSMDDSDEGLINFLVRGRHTSPFEHGFFRFHVKLPLFVVREWQRHRTWSYNEWSGRYAQLEPEWYVPSRDQVRHQVGKPGAYTFERIENDEQAEHVRTTIEFVSNHCFQAYDRMLNEGVAKEQARIVLPVNLYTEMYASVDPLNLMRFLSLRNHEAAMYEIREYAEVLEVFAERAMPISIKAFVQNGRVI